MPMAIAPRAVQDGYLLPLGWIRPLSHPMKNHQIMPVQARARLTGADLILSGRMPKMTETRFLPGVLNGRNIL